MTVQRAWTQMDGRRKALLVRCQKYAAFTLPPICTPEGYNENLEELQTDYQSVGAQGVNNLTNKLMLALFAPSRPFFRLDLPPDLLKSLAAQPQFDPTELQSILSVAESNCVKELDQMGVRPTLYLALKHLIITGNCLLILKKSTLRVLGLKKFVVKRSQSGKVIRILIREEVLFDELSEKAQEQLRMMSTRFREVNVKDVENVPNVAHYTDIVWDGKSYIETQHVDEFKLIGSEFEGKYTDETLPYRALTWELHDENNYGTGLVEQCAGDFAALSALSQAEVEAAILASQFRWLVNPAGQTKPEDLENSENGSALPGVQNDVIPLMTGTAQALQQIDVTNSKYVNRIGQVFLLGASVIRNAERVTAEEIRLVANELETSLGGVYSRLALDFQLPMAYWLIKEVSVDLKGTNLRPMVITGLDALSRNGDLDNLKLCLQDMAAVGGLPPQMQFVLKLDAIANAIFAGRGVDPKLYIKPPEQQKAELESQQQMALAQQVARPIASAVTSANPTV
ncbi:portal protein [Burkholderia phage AMP1]|uniref:Portal protein n=5 Tax=Ampunavirus BpAMP1 TaxID=2733589 RepID=A0A5C2IBL8_9CAUD|nr:head-tail adaptor [Burkholderia phage Bp-AMP1]QEP52858.1 portal protein [Burkholderia phage AMP1]CDL65188.1 Head portal-like protein [Burkholderia phage Bp-AMP2]CDL65228.1 Head portal-like protein [Burkholderia phage Bp-AMP3]CDL65268.1 Head portal-like protein [Burkholderia phage Bp-AMP4]CDK30102.1 Head portal-like protein [Burkholderia phage Bp-AMP1]